MPIPTTSTIAFSLVAGFIVFITVRGELPSYLCVIGIGNNCPAPPTPSYNSKQPATSNPTNTSNSTGQNGSGNSDNGFSTAIMTNPGGYENNPFDKLPQLTYDAPVLGPPGAAESVILSYGPLGGEPESTLPSGGYDPYGPYNGFDPYAGIDDFMNNFNTQLGLN